MQETINYNLKKPEANDNVNIEDFNFNFDKIDEKLFAVIQAWEDFKANGGEVGGDVVVYKKGIKNKLGYSSFATICGAWSIQNETMDNPVGVNLAVEPGRWSGLVPFINGEFDLGRPEYRYYNLYLVNPPNVSSKRELKENIVKFDDKKAYDTIKDLPIYTYNFKNGDGENMLGAIYDELPIECINEKAEGVDLYAYTSYCISALKVAIEKIEKLEYIVNKLTFS